MMQFLRNLRYKNKFTCSPSTKFIYPKSSTFLQSAIMVNGSNNEIHIAAHSLLKNIDLKIEGNNNRIEIGKTCHVEGKFYIQGSNNHIQIEERNEFFSRHAHNEFKISANSTHIKLQNKCRFIDTLFLIEDNEGKILINRETTTEGVEFAVTEPKSIIQIGRDCMFSSRITLRTGDSHAIYDKNTNERVNFAKNICLHDHIWIGQDVTILKGTTIEEGSIIGTKSLVTGKIPANVIATGIPAKVLKENIYWTRAR